MNAPLFDAGRFAHELAAALQARGLSLRSAAVAAGVSPATFSRALRAQPNTSHEAILRLRAWLAADHPAPAA